MLGVFAGIKDAVPIGKKVGAARTEGPISLLHYRATTLIFLSCCILVTSLEWIGNGANITCAMVGPDDSWAIPKGVINSYCYIQSTFVIPGLDVEAHPGVGQYRGRNSGERRYRAYYQWVSFILFLQAGLFYFPHLLYKNLEGGKLSNIICGLQRIILDKDERYSKEKALARYLKESMNQHNMWAIKLYLIRFVYLLNLVGNMVLIDVFLDWEFTSYGLQVIQLMEDDPVDRKDPMVRIFPKVTKCTMRKYGASGTIEYHDAICVLPINIINEKIYVFLWFWLLVLGVLTVLSLLYNTLIFMSSSLRSLLLRNGGKHKRGTLRRIDDISRHTQVGDWMLLYMLSRNLEAVVWNELITELHLILKGSSDESELDPDPSSSRRGSHYSHRSHSSRRSKKSAP